MSYNSARMSGTDVPLFQPLLPYIMRQSLPAGRNVKLFLEMTYPSEIPADALQDGMPAAVRPAVNRVGFFGCPTPRGMKWLRAEIGRASCRERVCKTVYISVDTDSLQKKILKN